MKALLLRGSICLILLVILSPPRRNDCLAKERVRPWKSTYDRAVDLYEKGDSVEAKKLLDEVRTRPRRLQIAFNAILVTEEFAKKSALLSPSGTGERQHVLIEVEPGAQSILGKKVVETIQQVDLQAGDLLESAGGRDKHARIVASFFIKLFDTQRVELEMIPDRTFQAVQSEGGSGDSNGKSGPPAAPSLTITLRPVVAPDGKNIRIDFFDYINAVHAFKPRSLSTALRWGCPGSDEIAMGPPQFDFEDRATAFRNSIEIQESKYFVISRIMVLGEKEVKHSLPLLSKFPLLKNFVSTSRIQKEHAQLILLFRPIVEGGGYRP